MSKPHVQVDSGYDGGPFAGWAAQPGERTVCRRAERGAGHGAARAGRADRGGAHGPRRPCARPGRLLRRPAAVPALGQRGAAARDHRAGGRGGAGRLLRPPRRALARLPLPRARARRRRRRSSAGASLWWPHALDEAALRACAALLRRHARLHRLHARRRLPPALRARRPRRPLGARRRRARVPHRGRHVHAPHEPRAGRDDARGRHGPAHPSRASPRCWRAARARRRAARRRRTGSTWRRCATSRRAGEDALQLAGEVADRLRVRRAA